MLLTNVAECEEIGKAPYCRDQEKTKSYFDEHPGVPSECNVLRDG